LENPVPRLLNRFGHAAGIVSAVLGHVGPAAALAADERGDLLDEVAGLIAPNTTTL